MHLVTFHHSEYHKQMAQHVARTSNQRMRTNVHLPMLSHLPKHLEIEDVKDDVRNFIPVDPPGK